MHDVKLNAFVDRPELGRAGREVAQPHRKVRWKPRTWPSDAARDPVAWRLTSPRHPWRVDPKDPPHRDCAGEEEKEAFSARF